MIRHQYKNNYKWSPGLHLNYNNILNKHYSILHEGKNRHCVVERPPKATPHPSDHVDDCDYTRLGLSCMCRLGMWK